MSTWRVARSLLQLRSQVDLAWPVRSKSSDGTIGDQAHQGTISDHNPDAAGVVRALDLTHDPAHGCDIGDLFEEIRFSRDHRVKYMIYNRRICSSTVTSWVWREYAGSDPHTGHGHLSVVSDSRADDTRPWSTGGTEMQLTGPDPYGNGTANEQAVELRHAYHAIMNGWQDDESSSQGVIARLARIEAGLAAMQPQPLDYAALAKALLLELRG